MNLRYRTVALLPLLAAAALVAAREPEESNALVMTAEIALQRDDCGRASSNYTRAAQHLADPKLAARATSVALDCGQFQSAERSAQRWHELVPADPGALRALMRAELGLYRIDEARTAFEGWLKDGSAAVAHGGANTVVDAVLQVAQQAGAPATLAMLHGVQSDALSGSAAQLALADLAIDGWSYREALQYADRALSAGAARAAVQQLLSRAHAGLGDAELAVAAADAARTAAPKEQSFAPADVLLLLGREREARVALEALRDAPATHLQAQRRLGQLAFNNGDYDEARTDFSELLGDKDSSAIAVYYLAAIAERRDDSGTALRGYELLTGTGLESAARARAANILYKEGQHEQALQLLRADKDDSPQARVAAEIAQAQLLANGGETDQALARIEDALERSPGHPDLLYQKAVLLEKAGRTDAAVLQLESLYRDRPRDSEAANALGFILADHNRELPRAEGLIKLALQAEPDNPAILDSLGWLDYRRGMPHDALPLLERAFRLAQDGDIGAHWGEVLWSIGEKSKAREAWNRAALADPDNALLKAARQRAGVPQMPATGTGTSI
jgi:tetratricopeptide (TPR) repeat protein